MDSREKEPFTWRLLTQLCKRRVAFAMKTPKAFDPVASGSSYWLDHALNIPGRDSSLATRSASNIPEIAGLA
jgi:hypothetical protein